MIIGVPKEIKLQEHRIGLTPESVKALTDKKHEALGLVHAGSTDRTNVYGWSEMLTLEGGRCLSMALVHAPCNC